MKKTSSALKVTEAVMRLLLTVCGLAAVGFVIVITGYLVVSGIPAIQEIGLIDFLTGTVWKPNQEQFGILPVILTSVLGTFGAILIGVPLGLLFAIYLGKMAPKPVYQVLRPTVDLLAGIPSVVYGLVGMMVLVPFVRDVFNVADGVGLFSSIIVLTVMVLPSIISVSETALKAVPREYEEASLALGATWNETVFKVSFPAAKSGIAASVVLGIGRAVGEAMAIMMVCGNVANMPSLFSSVRFLTTAIAGEMSYSSGLHRQALFSIALILYCFIMIINMILNFFLKKKEQ
ncbi:MAG TPA: phosphate ABC transporter permease subunit PstC [Candidatus Ruminococcus gallistercoris]|nr:phosphate ABC transporter permease subunit PstC [Acutalibacteraceae bacterium]HJB61357.1 phosphate ABC transporter permease subunit PstC [Candidatus Ruminococcus gallistercoris]